MCERGCIKKQPQGGSRKTIGDQRLVQGAEAGADYNSLIYNSFPWLEGFT